MPAVTPATAYARRHADKARHADYLDRSFRFKIGSLTVGQLEALLPTLSPAEAVIAEARLAERRAHRAAQRRKRALRLQEQAAKENDDRVA